MHLENLLNALRNVTNLDLDDTLERLGESRAGNKTNKIERIGGIVAVIQGDIFHYFNLEALHKINSYELQSSYENILELRKALADYYFLNEEILDLRKFISNLSIDIDRAKLTTECRISKELYLFENQLNTLKEETKINLYLDNTIVSESILKSIEKKSKHNEYHREGDYFFPILQFLFECKKMNKSFKEQIELTKQFFQLPEVAEQLSYSDIKIHNSGSTRCFSYFNANLHKLEELMMVRIIKREKRKSSVVEITLFGLWVIDFINKELRIENRYSMRNNWLVYERFNQMLNSKNVASFIDDVGIVVPEELSNILRSYLSEYFSIIKEFIKINQIETDGITVSRIKYDSKKMKEAFIELLRTIEKDKSYTELMHRIKFVEQNYNKD